MSKWDELLAALKAQYPIVNHRFVVKRVEMKEHGSTSLSETEKTITITIRCHDTQVVQLDSLIHEWAHAMWFDHKDWHDNEWGENFGKTYKVLERVRSET